MEIYCTRPSCPRPQNHFPDLDNKATLKTAQQKFCTACGMPLILVGRYLPSKLLGQGGFGAAFLARDRYTPAMRQCVVKQFQPSGDLNPQQLQIAQDLFEREAEVLEQLGSRHPQIPDLFAFFPLSVPKTQGGKEDQFFYLVQEFIDGQNLEEELNRKGQFSEAEALEVLREILNVLKFVHENGSIHRDIKPSNIMRDTNGRFYLLDFGAVKQVTTAAGAGGGRSTGIYSQGFAPPEQMAGAQVYPSTDLYALAVTVITLLTGKEAGELYDSYSNGWNWKLYAQVSNTVADVLDRMLLATPNQRFQSAQEVIDALTPRPASPPPPPPINPFPPPSPPPVQASTASTTMPPLTQPQSSQPVTTTPINPQPLSGRPTFSVLEIIGGAAFTGCEAGLLFTALRIVLGISSISIGLLIFIVGGLIFAQNRRILEGKDLPIIGVLTLGGVLFLTVWKHIPIPYVIVSALFTGAGAIAITALFQLIYRLLRRLL
ncbi:serine/threonine-protein kinase [Allocoleopsis sp.]|uniref:serine/threonine-protein kinase n=1 Tax=Allocoleopsis sp. TaxID=3088169 RepID=UPI002FD2D037